MKELFASREMTKKIVEKTRPKVISSENVKKDVIQVKNQVKQQISASNIIDLEPLEVVQRMKINNNESESRGRNSIGKPFSEENIKAEKTKNDSLLKKAFRGIRKLFGK